MPQVEKTNLREDVQGLKEAIFGCPEKGEIGMKSKLDELYNLFKGSSLALRILIYLIMGIGGLIGFITKARHLW